MLDLKRQNYVDWDVKSVFKLPERNNYAYRVILKYQDGTKHIQQKSGFQTKKEAEDAKKRTIGELSNGTYVVNCHVRLKEFWNTGLNMISDKESGALILILSIHKQ